MPRRRTMLAAAVAALAAVLAPPGTASAAPAGAPVAVQPWAPDGRPVAGSPSGAGAPLLSPGADYRDTLAKGETKYYAVRLGSTLGGDSSDAAPVTSYLSAFAVPRAGSHVGFLDGITLRLLTPGGTLCDRYDANFTGDDATAPVGGVVRRPVATQDVCQDAGEYLLAVQRDSAATSSADVWPLELRYLSEPAVGAPPAGWTGTVPGFTPATPAPVSGPTRTVAGSPGMDGAGTRLDGTGVYRERLAPGQTAYYRVPLDWGQRLFVTADFGSAAATRSGGLAVDGANLAVFSPVRGYVNGLNGSYTGQSTTLATQIPAVQYVNRLSSDSRVASASMAGWYYVQVSLHPSVAGFTTGGVPVTLRIRLSGSPLPGPDYQGDAAAAGFAAPVVPLSAPTPTGSGGSSGRSGGHPALAAAVRGPLGYTAIGLAVLLFAWPTVWLLRARRSGRTGS